MLLREELRQRIAREYRYAANKIQETSDPLKKLFYFSVLYSEAQRILNWQWDRELVLIYSVNHFAHTQINNSMKMASSQPLLADWAVIFEKLSEVTSDLATYFENNENNSEVVVKILSRIAEITYATLGNGMYLFDKGAIQL